MLVKVRTAILDKLKNDVLHLLFSQRMTAFFHDLFLDHLHLLYLLFLRGLRDLMLLRGVRDHLLR